MFGFFDKKRAYGQFTSIRSPKSYLDRVGENSPTRLIGCNGTLRVREVDYRETWYHGSPLKLTTLRKGSTITQDRDLARVFSHRPTIVSISVHVGISNKGTKHVSQKIKHDGVTPGFLYRIGENVELGDIFPHPNSSMEEGKEWLTNRELGVELIGPTQTVNDERLTEEEILQLKRKAAKSGNGSSSGLLG